MNKRQTKKYVAKMRNRVYWDIVDAKNYILEQQEDWHTRFHIYDLSFELDRYIDETNNHRQKQMLRTLATVIGNGCFTDIVNSPNFYVWATRDLIDNIVDNHGRCHYTRADAAHMVARGDDPDCEEELTIAMYKKEIGRVA